MSSYKPMVAGSGVQSTCRVNGEDISWANRIRRQRWERGRRLYLGCWVYSALLGRPILYVSKEREKKTG